MTRRNRRRQRTFNDTFDLIMNCTVGLIVLLAGTAMVGIIYAMFVIILAMPNTY
jgi:hypothetical protein